MRLAFVARRLVVSLSVAACLACPATAAFGWGPFSKPSAEENSPAAYRGSPNQIAPSSAPRNAPLFGGQELHLPAWPFAKKEPPQSMPQRQRVAAMPQRANTPMPQALAHPRNMASMPTTQPRWATGPGAQVHASSQAHYAPQRGEHPGIQYAPSMPTVMPNPHVARSSPVDPRQNARESSQPGLTPAQQLLTQAHQQCGAAETEDDYTRIIETCREAAGMRPDQLTDRFASELASWALNRRGQLKAEAGRMDDAIIDFDSAIDADPTRWRAIHNRGVLMAEAGQFEPAFDDFSRTIKLNPKFAKAFSNRAALYIIAGNPKQALQDYTRAIELDDSLAVAHRGRARSYHLLGQLDEAIKSYDAAVRLAPDDAYTVASRADLLTDLGRYADAARAYEDALRLDPNSSQANTGSAWLLATCPDDAVRNPKLAIARATKAIELSGGKEAVGFDTLAAAQASVGNFEAAVDSMTQAVNLASPAERDAFDHRLSLYQHAKPYRIAPIGTVIQASYESK